MERIFSVMSLFFIVVSCDSYHNASNATITDKTIDISICDYEDNWIYFNLKEPTELRVISHRANNTMCGFLATASMTIGLTKTNDTIRVFELCDVSKKFVANESVIVIPKECPNFQVSYPGVYTQDAEGKLIPHPDDLQVINTTYGIIERKNNTTTP